MTDTTEMLHSEAFPGLDHDFGRHQRAQERRCMSPEDAARYRQQRRLMHLNSHDVEGWARDAAWIEGQHYILDESAPDYVLGGRNG